MKTIFLTAAACFFLSGQAFAMTDAECKAMWTQADANSDGTLNGAEADRYMAMMRMAKIPRRDGYACPACGTAPSVRPQNQIRDTNEFDRSPPVERARPLQMVLDWIRSS